MNEVAQLEPRKGKLVSRFAERFGVEETKLLSTLKSTAFRQKDGEVSNEHMMALLVVADQYKLNPWTKEIYAFPDKQNGIVPVVGVDGWSRIINEHPQFDGMDFRQSEEMVTMDGAKPCPEWIECVMHRKDRTHPIVAREYLDECYRPAFEGNGKNGPYKIAGPWQSHTKRFLRHKTMIQCARIAFGFAGIYDQDEAERIAEAETARSEPARSEPSRPERELYSDNQFVENLPGFEKAIAGGRDPEQIIAMISSKYEITPEQAQKLRNLAAVEAEVVGDEI